MEVKNWPALIAICTFLLLSWLGYYFGVVRNENVCYTTLKEEIDSTIQVIDGWIEEENESLGYTKLELFELKSKVSTIGLTALMIKFDEYRSICDFYFYGFELRKK